MEISILERHGELTSFDRANVKTAAARPEDARSTEPDQTSQWWPRTFRATISAHADPTHAGNIAIAMIARETGCSSADAAGFLNSVEGRHFADGVVAAITNGVELEPAIQVTAARWMAWDTDAVTARAAGLCSGLPLLLASVIAQAKRGHRFTTRSTDVASVFAIR